MLPFGLRHIAINVYVHLFSFEFMTQVGFVEEFTLIGKI